VTSDKHRLTEFGNKLPRKLFSFCRKEEREAKENIEIKGSIICTAHQISLGDHIQEDKMGWTCGTNRDNKHAYRVLFDKCEIQKLHGRPTVSVLSIYQEMVHTKYIME
jgi:hypothetical protein